VCEYRVGAADLSP